MCNTPCRLSGRHLSMATRRVHLLPCAARGVTSFDRSTTSVKFTSIPPSWRVSCSIFPLVGRRLGHAETPLHGLTVPSSRSLSKLSTSELDLWIRFRLWLRHGSRRCGKACSHSDSDVTTEVCCYGHTVLSAYTCAALASKTHLSVIKTGTCVGSHHDCLLTCHRWLSSVPHRRQASKAMPALCLMFPGTPR